MMIFTSGTTVSEGGPGNHLTVLFAGANLIERFDVDSSGVCYLSMPLFHSNALLAGWSVAVGSGAAMCLPPSRRRFAARPPPLRRTYMNYVGKPLAYVLAPRAARRCGQPAAGRVRNEASDRDIADFSRRFDCTVWDGFGSTEARSSSPARTAVRPAHWAAVSPV